MKFHTILIILIISLTKLHAQLASPIAVGQWRSHFFNKNAQCLSSSGLTSTIYVGAYNSEYEYSNGTLSNYDKVNGFHDHDISQIYYNEGSKKLYIIYSNLNIDIKESGNVINFPYIKNSNVTGNKFAYDVIARGSDLYISTGLGIVVYNMDRDEVKSTYKITQSITPNVYSTVFVADSIFAATDQGLYVASLSSNNLGNYANWRQISLRIFTKLLNRNNMLIAAKQDSLFSYDDMLTFQTTIPDGFYTTGMANMDNGDMALVAENKFNDKGIAYKVNSNFGLNAIIGSNVLYHPVDVIYFQDEIFVADQWVGLVKISGNSHEYIYPSGPNSNDFYKILFTSDKMYATSGGVDIAYNGLANRSGLKIYDGTSWSYLNQDNDTSLGNFVDMMPIVQDPENKSIYIGSWGGGMLELAADGSQRIYNDDVFSTQFGGSRITGLAMDKLGNLWMSNFVDPGRQLVYRKADGQFISTSFYKIYGPGAITSDDQSQLWIITPKDGKLYCYSTNNTLDNPNDDRTSPAVQDLDPVNCVTKDQDGALWIGTTNGIGILSCPEIYLSGSCQVEHRVVNYDGVINATLFDYENVHTIAVDGANRKWVGTDNGAWLISENADKIIHQFNVDNSPLPSNIVNQININPQNGEVFFVTDAGLVSYRSDATEGGERNADELLIFPSPVPSGYTGNIAIRGVSANALVKITDVNGQLVYQTYADGGQANWNGSNYLGQRAHTGVYYVFTINSDGSESKSAKFVLIE